VRRSQGGVGVWRRAKAITRWTRAGRRCTPASRRGRPATPAAALAPVRSRGRRDQAGIAICGRRHRPHLPAPATDRAHSQNQTGGGRRAPIRPDCRCATRMRVYLPARLPLVGRRAEAYPPTRQNLLPASPCCSGQGNRSRRGNHISDSRFGLMSGRLRAPTRTSSCRFVKLRAPPAAGLGRCRP
jgi:hypothetical protein